MYLSGRSTEYIRFWNVTGLIRIPGRGETRREQDVGSGLVRNLRMPPGAVEETETENPPSCGQ